jgi:MHS family alpha-ketoglutarate permease-like MFS transporter
VEYVALWLRSVHFESLFFYYVAFASLISLVVYWRMTETSSISTIGDSETQTPQPSEN